VLDLLQRVSGRGACRRLLPEPHSRSLGPFPELQRVGELEAGQLQVSAEGAADQTQVSARQAAAVSEEAFGLASQAVAAARVCAGEAGGVAGSAELLLDEEAWSCAGVAGVVHREEEARFAADAGRRVVAGLAAGVALDAEAGRTFGHARPARLGAVGALASLLLEVLVAVAGGAEAARPDAGRALQVAGLAAAVCVQESASG